MTKNFEIDELRLQDKSIKEQIRTLILFEALKERASKGKKMTEHEKDFFCECVILSKLDDGKIEECITFIVHITF